MKNLAPHSTMLRAYCSALQSDIPGTTVIEPSGKTVRLRPDEDDLEVIHFRQIWNTTALGFLHEGEKKMTAAYTTIVTDKKAWCVYFDGRLAYLLRKPNHQFFEDLSKRVLRPIRHQNYYLKRKPQLPARSIKTDILRIEQCKQ